MFALIAVSWGVFGLFSCKKSPKHKTPEKKEHLRVVYEPRAKLFAKHTLRVSLPLALRPRWMNEIHDAYDANRNGRYTRLFALLRHASGFSLKVPGFAWRAKPGGHWRWEIRWSARRLGPWKGKVVLERGVGKGRGSRWVSPLPREIQVLPNPGIQGPLVAPRKNENPRYLRRVGPDGRSRAIWLWGACRAWVVSGQGPPENWLPHEWISREKTLFPSLHAGGYNLLNQWMAPWEFLLVHRDRASHWRHLRTWKRTPYAMNEVWRSYSTYDQGRALAFDRLVERSEGDPTKPTIHLLLSPIAHQNFQLREHSWGSQESGWSLENDRGQQHPSKLNGFSGYKANMKVWSFFEATPNSALSDWRSCLFDEQANYYRYLIARWGYSRALGVWVLMDELDAVGDQVGDLRHKTGWWQRPHPSRWLGQIIRLFRGKLKRSDGMLYQGDPFQHPIHAATTSFGGGLEPGANVDWKGPKQEPLDLYGWHWYPEVSEKSTPHEVLRTVLPLVIRGNRALCTCFVTRSPVDE